MTTSSEQIRHDLDRGPLLVKLGGAAIDAPNEVSALFDVLVALHAALPHGLVLVHGGGAAVDRLIDRLGLVTERRDGLRITPEDQIDVVAGVLAGSTNKKLVGQFRRRGVKAVGLCLGDGGVANVTKLANVNFDPGRVGEVHDGDARLVRDLLAGDFLPVFSSIGLNEEGLLFNVNADQAAAGLGAVIRCGMIVLLTDVPGVLDRDGQLLDELTIEESEERIATGEISGGMIPKVRGAAAAAMTASVPVVIGSWKDPDALRSIAEGTPRGTLIQPATARVAAVAASR